MSFKIPLQNILLLSIGIIGIGYAIFSGVVGPLFIAFEYGWTEASKDMITNWELFTLTYLLLLLSVFITLRTFRIQNRF